MILKFGKHKDRESGLCLMEAAAYFAGEPHTDRPECVCPVVAEYCRTLNDANWLNDNDRTEYLTPLVEMIVKTLSPESEERRAAHFMEVASRSVLPYVIMTCDRDDLVWLTLAQPDIVDEKSARKIQEMTERIKHRITNNDVMDYVNLELSVFEGEQEGIAMPYEMAIFDCATKIGTAVIAYCDKDYETAAYWAAQAVNAKPLLAENRYMAYSFGIDAVKKIVTNA